MICFPMFSTDEGEVLGRSECVCKCVLSLCGHIFAFSQSCEDILEGSLQLQKAVWGLRLGVKGSVRIIVKARASLWVMSGMQLREESVCISVVFSTSLYVHTCMFVCVCVLFIQCSWMHHETRTNKPFVPLYFVFRSRLLHNSHSHPADCDSDQQFPDKAMVLTALHVYELLMELFIMPRVTIYHIESHG